MGWKDKVEFFGLNKRVQSVPRGVTLTRKSEQASTDIRNIMKKYRKTGVINHINRKAPQYGDFSMATDLLSAMTAVDEAWAAFERLPNDVRVLADHRPDKLLQMLAVPEERQRLVEAGYDAEYDPTVSGPEAPKPQVEPAEEAKAESSEAGSPPA
jgi:hypothetical protein